MEIEKAGPMEMGKSTSTWENKKEFETNDWEAWIMVSDNQTVHMTNDMVFKKHRAKILPC